MTVLPPVRDERLNVAGCLESLLGQTAWPRVRVIDDGSTDGTAEIVAGLAAAEPRLELLAAGPLPEGLDAGPLLLAVLGLVAYPLAFPQVTRLVTGRSPSDPAFRRQRAAFLRAFSDALARGPIEAPRTSHP